MLRLDTSHELPRCLVALLEALSLGMITEQSFVVDKGTIFFGSIPKTRRMFAFETTSLRV